MKTFKQYVVDAFADTVFKGNPAAVCVLPNWIPDTLMQSMTKENNLSETAFAVKKGNEYELRWFTPGGEIDLCGHATLGTAYVLLNFMETDCDSISFQTKSGQLVVTRTNDLYEMDMPAYRLTAIPVTDAMEQAIGFRPTEAWLGRDLVCVMADERQVLQAVPDEEKLKKLDGLLLQLTAKGSSYDCVTRSFAPKLNVTEDPVCGSGHCHVIPLWAGKTGKNSLTAFQASERSGVLYCRMENDRVMLAGKAALYSKSEIFVPEEVTEFASGKSEGFMIRKATDADTERIAKTYEDLLHHEERNGSHSNWRIDVYPTIQIPLSAIPKGTMYVLEEQGEICASMVLNKEQPREYQQIDWRYPSEADKIMVIHTLCVPPQKAGKGYGRQMVRFAAQRAKEIGCKAIRSDTWAGNKPAASLYRKMGFRFAGAANILLQGLIPEEQVFFELSLEGSE